MKKYLLIAAVISIFNFQFSISRAQVGTDFGVNMFMSLDGGVSIFDNPRNTELHTGYAGGFSVGKWILSPLAFRASFQFVTVPHAYDFSDYNASYALGTAEFLWDFNSTFTRIRNWKLNFYPMLGLGLSFRSAGYGFPTDHEFQAMLGAQLSFRFARGWDLFLQGKVHFFPEAGEGGGSYLSAFTLGITKLFTDSPFHRRTEFESRSTSEDWFFGLGIGPNFSSFTFEHISPSDGMWGVAPDIMFGRNYSNFWTIRFELGGLTAHERYDTINKCAGDSYTYGSFHTDVMLNLTHALKFTRGKKLNVLPYLGAGLAWRYDDLKFDLAADFGLLFRYYIGKHSDLYADIKYLMVTPRIGGGTGDGSALPGILSSDILWVGLPSVTVGYIYNFGHSTTRYRMPVNVDIN